MDHQERVWRTAEMLAAQRWNEKNPQNMWHNQTPETQAECRQKHIGRAELMVVEFKEWFEEGARQYEPGFDMQTFMRDSGLIIIKNRTDGL